MIRSSVEIKNIDVSNSKDIIDMRVSVIGPGAMGCLIAGRITRHGHEVTLLDHNVERATVIANDGLRIETIDGDEQCYSCRVTTEPDCLKSAELVCVCVKAYDTETVAETLEQYLADGVPVLTLQNGLGNVESLARHVSAARVFGGTTAEGATLLAPGHVRHAGRGPTVIAPVSAGSMDEAYRLAEFLSQTGFDAHAERNLARILWKKLIVNAVINPLTALLGVPNGQTVEIPAARDMLVDIVREVASVATAENVFDDNIEPVELVETVARATSTNRSSMLQDITNRRRTEIDAILGTVVARAKQHEISVPVCTTLFGAVKALETVGRPVWRDDD